MGEKEPGVTPRDSSLHGGAVAAGPLPTGERAGAHCAPGEGPPRRGKTPAIFLDRSRALRRDATEAEALLWSRLRAGRMQGWKFRRQVPIGPYIADFICSKAKLVLELDGSQHADQVAYDTRRTAFLVAQGYRVRRFWNNDVLHRIDSVLTAILAALDEPPLPGASRLSLSPAGRGENMR
ncbi:MAG: endonuclease domain-containing protein [Sphingomonas sp.]|nr:endonuclease domain-containing protein [Sphingomonas sp.]